MKNTLLQNIISNFNQMEGQHFLDWFKESKQWMLEQEEKQRKEAFEAGEKNIDFQALHGQGKLSSSEAYVAGDRLK
jgi:hypothetical protein